MTLALQELFPESYAETAAWLRREVNANGDSLACCEQQLQHAVEQDPEFQALAAGCQVGFCHPVQHSVLADIDHWLLADCLLAWGWQDLWQTGLSCHTPCHQQTHKE